MSSNKDLEARVEALEEVVDHLRVTQPHLMPQPATVPQPAPDPDDTTDDNSGGAL